MDIPFEVSTANKKFESGLKKILSIKKMSALQFLSSKDFDAAAAATKKTAKNMQTYQLGKSMPLLIKIK